MAKDKYQNAVRHFERAEYSEAEKLLLELHRSNKKDYDVLNFLGILELHKRNFAGAVSKFQQVVRLCSKHHFAYYNLALSHHNLGQVEEAINCYKKTLKYNPDNLDALNNLGVLYYERKEYDRAHNYYDKVMKHNPANANTLNNLGNLYNAMEDYEKAEEYYKAALKHGPKVADYHFNLADCLLRQNKLHEALEQLGFAISINPHHYGALNSLSVVLIKFENYTEAENILMKIIDLQPNFAEAYHNLGLCYQRTGNHDKAVMLYQKALHNKHIRGQMLMDIGNLYLKEGKFIESEKFFKDAAENVDYKGTLYTNLGITQLNQGNISEAVNYTKNALKEDPNIAVSHYNLSHALLLNGDFRDGWEEYEWRKKRIVFKVRKFAKPELKNLDVDNKRIFVYDEQGLGDTIQFIRYLPMLKKLGCYIIFECDPRITGLIKNFDGYNELYPRTHTDEPGIEYDYHVALLSLPMLFGTELESIPSNNSYLESDSKLNKDWKERLGNTNKFRVGLVWAGNPNHTNDKNRSCPLDKLNSLLQMTDVEFYSLQKGPGLAQVTNDYSGKLQILDGELKSFSDTAAAIANMDLVISVDTSVTHLAGALGKDVWTMLPFLPDWRWLMDRDDSPWYPTMKLYRQKKRGDWETVVATMKEDLQKTIVSKK